MWGIGESEGIVLKDQKPEKRDESAWVTLARYSEIGFMIPATVLVGYFLGWLADRALHTHWIYLAGIILGAVAGFVSMIRKALASSREAAEEDKRGDGGGSDAG